MRNQWIILLTLLCCPAVYADPTGLSNYNYGTAPAAPAVNAPSGQTCQGNKQNHASDQQIGTYSYQTPTTAGTIVTTGTKHPDLPDNSCNNGNNFQPIIQPYINTPPPGPGPMPGPRH